MINLTRLLCGSPQPADSLRYGIGAGAPKSARERRPIVVWNITRRCNLRCLHCYSDSGAQVYPGELSFEQCRSVIDDLAQFGVPGLLLSGGEPMVHPRFFDIARYAREQGLRLTASTNGTRITPETAQRLKQIGFAYIGISLDGIGETHDRFRGRRGAFDRAVAAFRNCKAVGQKSGLRLTLTRQTVADLETILDFIEKEGIQRVCFYHLVYSGRGAGLVNLTANESRSALDLIMSRVKQWHDAGTPREVLTVDQPADGAYLYMNMAHQDSPRADEVRQLLEWNGGGAHGSGVALANIDTQGKVHPDQFWQQITLGNVKEKPFSEIWQNSDNEILLGLRNRLPRLKGRCAQCVWKNLCGGGFRVRAWQRFEDPWQEDPGCYLTDEEIGLAR